MFCYFVLVTILSQKGALFTDRGPVGRFGAPAHGFANDRRLRGGLGESDPLRRSSFRKNASFRPTAGPKIPNGSGHLCDA